MKTYAFEVRGTIKVKDTDWPVGAHIVIEAETLAELRGGLDAAIQGLYKMGLRPSTPVAGTGRGAIANKTPQPPTQGGSHAPKCRKHGVDMAQSKYQNKAGITVWYCPDRTDGVYCLCRCNVYNGSNHQEFYEVRGK